MRETQFIEQNKEKWQRFEQLLETGAYSPEELNEIFIQITDDLSYARTFYPNRSVRVYLNGLARRIFHNVYSHRRFPLERLKTFWTEELPRTVWESRKALLLSLGLFIFAFMIGVVSSRIDPEFARSILGDMYVEETLKNIENGDPMAIYKDREVMGMSLGIAANNLRVAFLTVITGVLSSIGTFFIMLYNGIMVGAFQYFFIIHGEFWNSFLTIWIHGALEISAIIIAGGAGLVLGSGLLFPRSYTRVQAFQMSARKGIKIFLGIVPIIILAGFFEGFLTRSTDVPKPLRFVFILINFGFVLWYFVLLPWSRARKGYYALRETEEKEPLPKKKISFDFGSIKGATALFADVFGFFATQGRRTLAYCGLLAVAVFGLSVTALNRDVWEETFQFSRSYLWWTWPTMRESEVLFGNDNALWLLPVQMILLSIFGLWLIRKTENRMPDDMKASPSRLGFIWRFLAFLPISFCFIALFKLDLGFLNFVLTVMLYPLLGLWMTASYFEQPNPFASLASAVRYINWTRAIGIGLILALFVSLLFLFLETPIFGIIVEFFGWNAIDDETGRRLFELSHLMFLVTSFGHFLAFSLFTTASVFLYFTCREINTAHFLYGKMENIGKQRSIRGLARE